MSATAFQEIVRRLDDLEPSQAAVLLRELQRRVEQRPQRSLWEFESNPANASSATEDWVGKLRAEWED